MQPTARMIAAEQEWLALDRWLLEQNLWEGSVVTAALGIIAKKHGITWRLEWDDGMDFCITWFDGEAAMWSDGVRWIESRHTAPIERQAA
jgi:hypothetical protein